MRSRSKKVEGNRMVQWLRRLARLPGRTLIYALGKWKNKLVSEKLLEGAMPLPLPSALVLELLQSWRLLEQPSLSAKLQLEAALPLGTQQADDSQTGEGRWTAEENRLIADIRERTWQLNRNNVTRTEAYLTFYRRHPELHWALLAHMVSRNGGWNMTDLQGELLPRLLRKEQREALFHFLERANYLIFGDAYPQLLLYEAALQVGKDLTHLLPAFGVSRFMRPVWAQFLRRRDPVVLTTALIVNEQHFIEQRVVRHPYYREHVLDTAFFGLQSLLQLNLVLFPSGICAKGKLRLDGLILENFSDLHERIEFGKRLYMMLFSIPVIRRDVEAFAATAHTGSRADYAPWLFARRRTRPMQRQYSPRLQGLALRPGAEPLFSPELGAVWPDQRQEPVEQGDWYRSANEVGRYFRALSLPSAFEIANEYGFALSKVEIAVLAAQQFEL